MVAEDMKTNMEDSHMEAGQKDCHHNNETRNRANGSNSNGTIAVSRYKHQNNNRFHQIGALSPLNL